MYGPGSSNNVDPAAGELYALVTNTPPNGAGGIVFQISPVPEPATWASRGLGALLVLAFARRRRAAARPG